MTPDELAHDLSAASDADDVLSLGRSTGYAAATLGIIVPAGNRMIERQLAHFAPPLLGVHAARLRMNGRHHKPLPGLLEGVARAAADLSDTRPDLIAFQCTANSMEFGVEGDARIRETIEKETGVKAVSTGLAVTEAIRRLGLSRLVLVTPYKQASNDHEKAFLKEIGVEVVSDAALGENRNLGPSYLLSPRFWFDQTKAYDRPEADGVFLSCAGTTQLDAVAPLERTLGKPVVNSNQAIVWASLLRLRDKLGVVAPIPAFGRLMQAD